MKRFNWRAHLKVHPAAELFPLLSADELKEFAEDIRKNGLRAQIILGTDGRLLDGRNRLDALALLGCLEPGGPPTGLRIKDSDKDHLCAYTDGGDPFEIVLSLNLHRRHLTPKQKQEVIAKVLKAKPQTSDRQIGKMVKADHKTVAEVRRKKEATGEISPVEKRIGADGKARKPAKKAKLIRTAPPPEATADVRRTAADTTAEGRAKPEYDPVQDVFDQVMHLTESDRARLFAMLIAKGIVKIMPKPVVSPAAIPDDLSIPDFMRR
jgi:hypothetical protein